jgi:signal recognition particle subunit SRP54
MHRQMSDMMKRMGKGGRNPFGGMPGMGMPQLPPGVFPGGRR